MPAETGRPLASNISPVKAPEDSDEDIRGVPPPLELEDGQGEGSDREDADEDSIDDDDVL